MKHIALEFNYGDLIQNKNLSSPVVAKLTTNNQIIYDFNSEINNSIFKKDDYFSIYALNEGYATLNFSSSATTYPFDFSYSINNGAWIRFIGSNDDNYIWLNKGDVLRMKCTGRSTFNYENTSNSFLINANLFFVAFGNINSLFYGDNWNDPSIELYDVPYKLSNFFRGSSIVSAKNLSLPTSCTTNADHCFYKMFSNCKYLIDIPSTLPAFNSDYCAAEMFDSCISLEYIPNSCDIIVNSGSRCCERMFRSSGITNCPGIIENNHNVSKPYAFSEMFLDCINLTSGLSEYQAKTINPIDAYKCYCMFKNCTNLYSAYLPRSGHSIGEHSCEQMYKNCKNMSYVAVSDYPFVKEYGLKEAFSNCERWNESTVWLNFGEIEENGCDNMFNNCSSLKVVQIYTYRIKSGGLKQMFNNCKSLTSVSVFTDTISLGTVANPEYFSFYEMFDDNVPLESFICSASNTFDSSPLSISSIFLPDTNGIFYTYGNWTNSNLNGWTISRTLEPNEQTDAITVTIPNEFTNETLESLYNSMQDFHNYYAFIDNELYILYYTSQTRSFVTLNKEFSIQSVWNNGANSYVHLFINSTDDDWKSKVFVANDIGNKIEMNINNEQS